MRCRLIASYFAIAPESFTNGEELDAGVVVYQDLWAPSAMERLYGVSSLRTVALDVSSIGRSGWIKRSVPSNRPQRMSLRRQRVSRNAPKSPSVVPAAGAGASTRDLCSILGIG